MDFFGLDIGSYRLKAAELAPDKKGKFRLVALGSAPSTQRGLDSDSESDLTNLAMQIKKLHQVAKFTTKNVAISLPEDKVFSQLLLMPKLSGAELDSALKWEAEQYVPLPLEEVTLTHQVVGVIKKDGTEQMRILLAAAPTRLIEKVTLVMKTADLEIVTIETEMIPLCRSLVEKDHEVTLVVDFGARATDLALTEGGEIIFSRSIPTAGEALTRAVANTLGLEKAQAEEYKKAYGVDPEKLKGKVKEALDPLLMNIIEEMRKAVEFYRAESGGQRQVNRAIISGGTASLPEVVSLLAQRLGVEIQVGDPFVKIVKDEMFNRIPKEEAPLFGIALGLAMKDLG